MPEQHYPPQPVAHAPHCPEAGDGVQLPAAVALHRYPYAIPHACQRAFTNADTVVVLRQPPAEPHAYRTSMIWPANAARALCWTCRGTHEGE